MNIIVTGGAGFIGSALCRYLVGDIGARVLNIDKLTYAANLSSLASIVNAPNYGFLHADICDRAAMDAAMSGFQPDAIVHLAAESHVDRSITASDEFIQTNINGTHVLLEAARTYWSSLDKQRADAFRFLHVSTDEVYGSLGPHGLFHERSPYNPSSPYSASKAASDHLVTAWNRTYGLPCLISNCSNNYGPCQFPEKLIPLMILNAMDRLPLAVYGDGQNVRDWLYVEDHARALWVIVTRGKVGERYNVGARSEQTNLAVVEQVCALLDEHRPSEAPHSRLIRFVTDRPGHDWRYAIDVGKLERELGWRPSENFAGGISKTVQWYLDNEAWWGPLRRNVYGGQRLGIPG